MDATTSTERVPLGIDVRAALCRVVLVIGCGLMFWPALFGLLDHQVVAIVSGSMEPQIGVGDVVISTPLSTDQVLVGQIVTVPNPATHGTTLLTHRVRAISPDGDFITKGDANPAPDSTPVPPGPVSLGTLRVPWVGYPVVWAGDGEWGKVAATALALLALVRGSNTRPLVRAKPAAMPRSAAAVGATTVLVAFALTATHSPTSQAAFTAAATTKSSTWTTAPAAPAASDPYSRTVLAAAPSLYLRLDETSGTAVKDTSGRTFDVTYCGTVTHANSNAIGGPASANSSAWFDGAGAIASTRTYADTPEFTVEAFLKTRGSQDSTGTSTLAEFVTPAGFRDRLFFQWGSLYYQATKDSAPVALQFYLNPGTWQYLGVAVSGTKITIVTDTQQWSGTIAQRTTSAPARFVIGTHLQPWGDPTAVGVEGFKGGIDEFALYTQALTTAQMQAHKTAAGH